MLPHEHFIVAFVPVFAYVVLRDRQLISLQLTAIVFIGSQFPDLVDKPLAHQFGLIPSGRVFMHSLPIAIPFLLIVAVYGWKTDRNPLSGAFIFAYLSHLVADHYTSLFGPDPHIPAELLWPLLSVPARTHHPHWAGPDGINIVLWTLFSAVVLLATAYFVVRDLRTQLGQAN